MVKVFAILKPLLHGLMKLFGMTPQLVEIEPGTILNIWVPTESIKKPKTSHNQTTPKPNKPVLVFLHGFAVNGLLTWVFQIPSFTHNYTVYVPDLLFFGGSITDKAQRSPGFQAQCLVMGLKKLGVEKCTIVGLSYGGLVGFKMAQLYPDFVEALVGCSTVTELTESISRDSLENIGFPGWSDYLLPESVNGVKVLLSIATHKWPWLPDFVYRDFLEVMFNNRKERAELLEALVISDNEATAPNYHQRIHLLWGDDDKIFNLELAQRMREQLGIKASLQYIEEAGHLLHLERPFVYNRLLHKILVPLEIDGQ